MNYRGVINMLVMCGCIGQSGGGWAHYVGQEKLRPQAGWVPLAFALDWGRPPRQQNSTSFFYAHTEPVALRDDEYGGYPVADGTAGLLGRRDHRLQHALDPHGLAARCSDSSTDELADRSRRRQRMPALEPKDYVAQSLKSGELSVRLGGSGQPAELPAQHVRLALEHPRFSRARGTNTSSSTCSARRTACLARISARRAGRSPSEVRWHDEAPRGKLDLLVTLDFRMSTTCVYSDIVLPTATWYEKNDLNTSDMHPFIHPLTGAVDPAWEAKSDWEIYKAIAKAVLARSRPKCSASRRTSC